ncbi:glycosyltransferase family 9 protein [Spirosoma sordidisoli]|uniref:Glycosyltransferase family 9 protein n=1 Tax=Spirosoma sordidisoli TaxID=2502893 RepID=A0A4Q2UPS7_9BACT|nr:glycosyltransferase family 9 protein [Spirosoma sordidisoli]RYC69635.1 hypothetical protein EQG79_13625 [Spirosoma sordidisoli]
MNFPCYVSAGGLGDSVSGLYAACGLADQGGEGNTVVFHTRHPSWLASFSHPNLVLAPHLDNQPMGPDMNEGYDAQLHYAQSRKQHYCTNLGRQYVIEGVRPARPRYHTELPFVLEPSLSPYVVLSPFSAYSSRAWPLMHWVRLAIRLGEAGFHVVVLDSNEEKMAPFQHTGASWWFGMHPSWVMGCLEHAAAVVANDSGLAHAAGLLGTPTVAVMAQLSPLQVFSHTDVQGVIPSASCSPCAWRGDRGWRKPCDDLGCSALHSIPVETVLQRTVSITRPAVSARQVALQQ